MMATPIADSGAPLADAVSVIIPTHRRPEYLRAAIQSAVQQSSPPLEIVVVDDGGTLPRDFSPGEIPAGVELQIRHIAHAGQCGARRAGFDASRGTLLLFLDDDDTLVPDAVATLRALHLRDPDLVAAVGAAESFDADGAPLGHVNRPLPEIRSDDLWAGNQIANAGCALIRRAAYQLVGGWDLDAPNAGDYLLWMKLARVGRIAGTEQIVLHYRWHLANESAKGNQFLTLPAFRRTFRRVFPDLVRSETEDRVLAGMVAVHTHDAIWYWRELIRWADWGEAARRGARLLGAMVVACAGTQSRRALGAALALWRPAWMRRTGRSE